MKKLLLSLFALFTLQSTTFAMQPQTSSYVPSKKMAAAIGGLCIGVPAAIYLRKHWKSKTPKSKTEINTDTIITGLGILAIFTVLNPLNWGNNAKSNKEDDEANKQKVKNKKPKKAAIAVTSLGLMGAGAYYLLKQK